MDKDLSTNSLKQLAKKLTDSSQKLLAAFLDDDFKAKQKHQEVLKQISLAIEKQAFVVLQLTNGLEPNPTFETTYGHIKSSPNNPELIILTDDQSGTHRMIPTKTVVKISILNKKKLESTPDEPQSEMKIKQIK